MQSKRTEWEHEQNMEKLRQVVLTQVDRSKEISDDGSLQVIDQVVLSFRKQSHSSLAYCLRLRKELFFSIRKLGVVQELLDDPEVTEIMINGTDHIFYEKQGRIFLWDKRFYSRKKLEDVIQQIVADNNRMVNEAEPIVDARLKNGARVNVVLAPIALNGPIVTIRRFPDQPIKMQDLVSWGSISQDAATFLERLVKAKYNIFISGGTGSGKTTFLNALSNFIPSDERVITIEDSAELRIQNQPNLIRLETRNGSREGARGITPRELVRTSLRMRPDRIIVGEVRGAEVIDMLQAFNTGHDGSLSTGHANSPKDMMSRLEMMALMGMDIPMEAIRRQIASAIDIVVHLGRLRDKSRKVLEIAEVTGQNQEGICLRTLYGFHEVGQKNEEYVEGVLEKQAELCNRKKLANAGL